MKPFDRVVKDLIILRSQYPKEAFLNLVYKNIANSIYGLTSQGIASKKKFDVLTGRSQIIEGGCLSNPIICGYITALVRCVVGECLHNIHRIGGKVVSVTTDGFITDMDNLEDVLLEKASGKSGESTMFLRLFRLLRHHVISADKSQDTRGLEIKHVEGYPDLNDENFDDDRANEERGLIT